MEMIGISEPIYPPHRPESLQTLAAVWRRVRRNQIGLISLVILVVLGVGALSAPGFVPFAPDEQSRGHELRGPSATHWVGTDELGRDVFSRVMYGLRLSFLVASVGVALGTIMGTLVGLIAGYWEGLLGAVLMRINDGLIGIPGILLALVVVTALRPSFTSLVIALAFLNLPIMARLARAGVATERGKEYVLAAVALGGGALRIIFREILRNALPALVVQVSILMAYAILIESGLSFLGLGLRPPAPTLGGMLNASRPFMRVAPWYTLFPAITLSVLILAFNGIADLINILLDPRSRRM